MNLSILGLRTCFAGSTLQPERLAILDPKSFRQCREIGNRQSKSKRGRWLTFSVREFFENWMSAPEKHYRPIFLLLVSQASGQGCVRPVAQKLTDLIGIADHTDMKQRIIHAHVRKLEVRSCGAITCCEDSPKALFELVCGHFLLAVLFFAFFAANCSLVWRSLSLPACSLCVSVCFAARSLCCKSCCMARSLCSRS